MNSPIPNNPVSEQLGLADMIKEKTWPLHQRVERSGAVLQILKKTITLQTYRLYLRNLLPIYEALETAMSQTPYGGKLGHYLDERIYRAPSLYSDLEHLCKPDNLMHLDVLAASQQYQDVIHSTLSENPAALLGHIYVRYLEDLNSAQIMRELLLQRLNIPESYLTFYAFPGIINLEGYSKALRQSLNALELSQTGRQSAIDGAVSAFNHNIRLSIEAAEH